jgi:hypothetical protein
MDEETNNDPQLNAEQLNRVKALSDSEIKSIDEALLGNSNEEWRKVARVVGSAMTELKETHEGIPDVFFADRIKILVEQGLLESQGNLNRMRFSEVRRQDQQ